MAGNSCKQWQETGVMIPWFIQYKLTDKKGELFIVLHVV